MATGSRTHAPGEDPASSWLPPEEPVRPKVLTARPSTVAASHVIARAVRSQRALAAKLGIAHSKVGRWCSPGYEETPSLARLHEMVRVAPEVTAAALRWLSDALEDRAPLHVPPELHALNIAGESGDVARAARIFAADGQWSRAELVEMQRELVEAREATESALRDVERLLENEEAREP